MQVKCVQLIVQSVCFILLLLLSALISYSEQNISVVMKTDHVMNYYAVHTHLYESQQNTEKPKYSCTPGLLYQVFYFSFNWISSVGSGRTFGQQKSTANPIGKPTVRM